MSRPLRIIYPGAWYHIIDRCYAGQTLFRNNTDRETFLEICAQTSDVYNLEIHAYCLLNDCFHLLVRTPDGNISQAMRQLLSKYSQYANKVHNHQGPLFAGRYKSILIENDLHILQVSRHIHRLPKETRCSRCVAMYPWSSYSSYINDHQQSNWLHNQEILGFMALRNNKAMYRIYVETTKDQEIDKFYKNSKTPAIMGSTDFKQKIARDYSFDAKEVPQARELITRPTIAIIINAVAQAFDVTEQSIKQSRRGRGKRNLPRSTALYLCRNSGGHSLKEIAKNFGVAHYSAVSVAIKRLTDSLDQNITLKTQIQQLQHKLARFHTKCQV